MTAQSPEMLLGAQLDKCHDAAQFDLGSVARGPAGKLYRYVKFVDAVAYVAGHVVTRASATTWDVTNDRAGGSAVAGHEVVGVVFQSTVPTQNQYGWVLINGLAACSGTYAAGDYVIPHATTDGEAVVSGYTAAKANYNIFGVALSNALVNVRLPG